MRRIRLLLLAAFIFVAPISSEVGGSPAVPPSSGVAANIDIDRDGTIDCIDTNGDKVCEEGWPFDADGDGSSPKVTCTGVGAPLPSCLFNGDVINEDYVDDTNCFIPMVDGSPKGSAERCNGTKGYTLSQGAIYHLPAGVAQIRFPCWNHDVWTAHANTPSSAPPETVASDPRAAGTFDEQTDAAFGHCPLDEWGAEVFSVAWGSWQGVVRGEGTDLRTHQRMIDDGYLTGSYVRDDRGNTEDGAWFDRASFVFGDFLGWFLNACTSVGGCNGEGGTGSMSPARLSTTLGSTVGFGKVQVTPSIGTSGGGTWTPETQEGYMCVCNSNTNSCGTTPDGGPAGYASADDWTEGLIAGQRLVYAGTWRTDKTSPVYVELTMSRDGADAKLGVCTTGGVSMVYQPCSNDGECDSGTCSLCGDVDEVMLQFGHMQQLEEAGIGNEWNAHQGIAGMDTALDGKSGANAIFAPPPEWFAGGVTFENITFHANDTWNTPGDLCADTFTSEGEIHNFSGAGSTDPDCDTHPFFRASAGGGHTIQNSVFKEWGAFAIDQGGSTMGYLEVLNNTFIHGYGSALGDFGFGSIFRGNYIKSSMFRSTMVATFGPQLRFEKTTIENVTVPGGFVAFNGQYYSHVTDLRVIGVTWGGPLIHIGNGSRFNLIRNIFVEGTAGRTAGTSANPVVKILGDDANFPTYGNVIDTVVMTGAGMPSSNGGQFPLIVLEDSNKALGDGVYGNFILNITSMHSDADSCLIGKADADDSLPDLLFEKNTFKNLNVGAGRTFCRVTGSQSFHDPDDGTVPNVRGMISNGTPRPDPIVRCRTLSIDGDGTTDDNLLFISGESNFRIQNAWCQMAVTQATDATLTFEDDSDNAVTGLVTCSDPGTTPVHALMTANNSLSAGESLRFDNTTAPTATVEVVVCADIIAEWL